MPSINRLPYFPFDVGAYLNDPAVLAMSADTEGLYVRLLARMWQSGTPGRVNPDLIHEMAGVWRLAEQYRVLYRKQEIGWEAPEATPEEIGRLREDEIFKELAMAFDSTSEPGIWVQKRMVIEWKRALTMSAARRKGGRLTQKHRKNIQAELEPTSSLAPGNREVDVEVDLRKDLSPTLRVSPLPAPGADAPRRRPRFKIGPNRTITDRDIARAAELTGVTVATAAHLAERIRLEGEQRGYLNYPSALLNWCKREAQTEPNGHADPAKSTPQDGDRAQSPTGPVVWWQGAWRIEDEARFMGWKS